MKMRKTLDLVRFAIGIPALLSATALVVGMISTVYAYWGLLSTNHRIIAVIGMVLITLGIILWIRDKASKPLYAIPKILMKRHNLIEQILLEGLKEPKEQDLDWVNNCMALLGANPVEIARNILGSDREFDDILNKQVTNIADTIGNPATKTRLGWFIDKTKGGVNELVASNIKLRKLGKIIDEYVDNPPTPEIAGDIGQIMDYSYQINSAYRLIEYAGYDELASILGQPQSIADRYGIPIKTKERMRLLIGKLNKDIHNYYRSK